MERKRKSSCCSCNFLSCFSCFWVEKRTPLSNYPQHPVLDAPSPATAITQPSVHTKTPAPADNPSPTKRNSHPNNSPPTKANNAEPAADALIPGDTAKTKPPRAGVLILDDTANTKPLPADTLIPGDTAITKPPAAADSWENTSSAINASPNRKEEVTASSPNRKEDGTASSHSTGQILTHLLLFLLPTLIPMILKRIRRGENM